MKKVFKPHKPDVKAALAGHLESTVNPATILAPLKQPDIARLFFHILQQPEHVSFLSELMAKIGYSQNNMVMSGARGEAGDELVLCRWKKAASGAMIMATRLDAQGELEVLFGKKKASGVDGEFWSLPGGHYELDDHASLEHTLVAELIEETALIPLSDEFLGYIEATIEMEKGHLPYTCLQEAENKYIARDVVWELVTVVSGEQAHWEKRCVNIGYRVHFNDGAHLQPTGSDDIGQLKWFKLSQIHDTPNPKSGKLHENAVYLEDLKYGNNIVIEMAIRKMHAWELCSQLINTGTLEDLEFFSTYLMRLKGLSVLIEEIYGIRPGALMRNCLVGPKYKEYITRAMAIHNLRSRLEKELYKLKPGNKTVLNMEIERHLLTPFVKKEDYL